MGELSPDSLLKDSLELFSLPDIYFQISEMINDPRFSAKDIGKVIGKDPALSIRLLKIVNSSLYGFQSKVDRISRAITIVGIDELKNLVVATSVVNKFKKIPSDLIDMTDFWLRSVKCGVVAKHLAVQSSVLHRERLFLAGLLHDIGSLVFYYKLPEESMKVLRKANHNRKKVGQLEQEIIGFTHAELGGLLIKTWGLPESLHESVNCYLTPHTAHVHKLDAYLVSLATRLVDHAQQGLEIEDILSEFAIEGLSIMRLDVDQIARALVLAEEEFSQVFELISLDKRFH